MIFPNKSCTRNRTSFEDITYIWIILYLYFSGLYYKNAAKISTRVGDNDVLIFLRYNSEKNFT
jgi:hypothetical protein